jgi:hypothetical protein
MSDSFTRRKEYDAKKKAARKVGSGLQTKAGKEALERLPGLIDEVKQLKESETENKRRVAQLEAELAAARVKDDEIKEKIADISPAKGKAKGRGKKTVGNIAETLEGKTVKARVLPVKKDQITKKMIDDYSKELRAKKEKIERIQSILEKQ